MKEISSKYVYSDWFRECFNELLDRKAGILLQKKKRVPSVSKQIWIIM
jgi:hypothetical protein